MHHLSVKHTGCVVRFVVFSSVFGSYTCFIVLRQGDPCHGEALIAATFYSAIHCIYSSNVGKAREMSKTAGLLLLRCSMRTCDC